MFAEWNSHLGSRSVYTDGGACMHGDACIITVPSVNLAHCGTLSLLMIAAAVCLLLLLCVDAVVNDVDVVAGR